MKRLLASIVVVLALFYSTSFAQFVNGDFESGRFAGWTEYSSHGYTVIGTGDFFASTEIQPPVTPRSGNWMSRLGGFGYEINSISQTITLPSSTPLYLAFYVQTRSSSGTDCVPLWATIAYLLINGQAVDSTYICQYYDIHSWTLFYFDVSALSGQSVQVAFKAEAPNSLWAYLYLDDISITSTTDVKGYDKSPETFLLRQNYPNPFNPKTVIRYLVPSSQYVSIKVYDVFGREVETLVNEKKEAGEHEVEWNAETVSSGIYFYRLLTEKYSESKKLLLQR
jgi:hypothetical protein